VKVRFAVAPDAGARDAESLIAFAQAVEARGFDGAWLSDLPLGPGVDPLLGLALLAGRTVSLRLGANIVPLGRNPFLLAKALAQLDRLSAGRLLLSFVPGQTAPGEREALGWVGAGRGEVLEAAVADVRSWWSGRVPGGDPLPAALAAELRPRSDPLEVWLGGHGPKALERVGRIADGWLGARLGPGDAAAARASIQESAARAGRAIDAEHFGLSIAYARTVPEPALLDATAVADPRELPVGADALHALVERLIDAGLSKFVLRPAGPVAAWDGEAAWLADAVLDLQS
jgi:alkanesulfonate monooxygenase SsuD/methylene tetrahydromethanopterin reductase-like flavin-dependent oxidoreductase (luciferase family)